MVIEEVPHSALRCYLNSLPELSRQMTHLQGCSGMVCESLPRWLLPWMRSWLFRNYLGGVITCISMSISDKR